MMLHNHKAIDHDRIVFTSDGVRTDFFALLKDRFETWVSLREAFSISRTMLDRYRAGKVSLPYGMFKLFLHCVEETQRPGILRGIEVRDRFWGRAKGGKITYHNHPSIFEHGRNKANSARKSKYVLDQHVPLTPGLAEFVGIYIGDGFFNKYGNVHTFQITGHTILDKEYHNVYIRNLLRQLFPSLNAIYSVYGKTRRITINSKQLYLFLTGRFAFTPGEKAYTIEIPSAIFRADDVAIGTACVRGIFDSDGYVFFDRRRRYVKPYVRIGLHMKSKKLLRQIAYLLARQGIPSFISRNGEVLQINGFRACKRYVQLVGFSNPRHKNKIGFLL